jgi:hypothetical protein
VKDKKDMEQQLEEKNKELEKREFTFNEQLKEAVHQRLHAMKEAKRQQGIFF